MLKNKSFCFANGLTEYVQSIFPINDYILVILRNYFCKNDFLKKVVMGIHFEKKLISLK